MPALKEKAITLLGSVSGINMQTSAAQTLFTVPIGKVARIMYVVVRDPTASLARGAGATDYDFTQWLQSVDLTGMTGGAGDYRILQSTHNTSYAELTAATAFQVTVATGCDATATATFDVFGYLT